MSGRIPDSFIQDLIARVDIVEVIGSRLELKRAGREFKALSPFTNEKSASFFVSPAKQMFFDFSSGRSGTAISFLMEYERLSFPEAVEELARQAGVEVPRVGSSGPSRAVLEGPLDALAFADRVYRAQLREAPQAVKYLKKRGVSGETAKTFGIGYAPESWDALTRQLPDPRHAIEAGLLIEKDQGGAYDRFRNRIMFPIRDTRGRVIGFGGRTLGNDPAKYLNSPETVLFHKGRNLFGLYEARQAVAHPAYLLVVEGYMDVVALAQAGIPEAVATLGTATTQDHLKLLYRATSRVVFCFDGDRAGRSAAWRALEQALPEVNDGREAAFMFLPEGQDPDTLVQEIGAEAFRQRVDEAVPLTQFLINELSKRSNLSNIDGRARFAAELKPYFERMLGATLRTTLVDAIVPIVRMPRADVEAMLGGRGGGEGSDNNHQDRRMLKGPVLRLLQLVLDRPALASSIQGFGELHSLDEPGLPLLLRVVEYFHDHPEQNAAALTSTWDDPAEAKLLGDIPPPESRIFANEAAMVAEFNDGFERLRTQARRQRASELLEIARERELSAGELAELRELTASRTAQTLDRPV